MGTVVMEEDGNHNGIVKVDPKPNKGWMATMVDMVEKVLVRFMFDPTISNHFLTGPFAPVKDETPPSSQLPVIGFLPVYCSLKSLSIYFFCIG